MSSEATSQRPRKPPYGSPCNGAYFHRCIRRAVLAAACIFAAAAQAQETPGAPRQLETWDAYRLNMMIRNAIIALNQANITGNYTVLRDLGTPDFRRANDSARLAIRFAELRAKAADFSPVFFINPTLVQQPSLDRSGAVRMTGFFPTRPERIVFDVSYQRVEGKWGLADLTVDVQPAPVGEANALESALKAAAATVNSQSPAGLSPSANKPSANKKPGPAKASGAKNEKSARKAAATNPAAEK